MSSFVSFFPTIAPIYLSLYNFTFFHYNYHVKLVKCLYVRNVCVSSIRPLNACTYHFITSMRLITESFTGKLILHNCKLQFAVNHESEFWLFSPEMTPSIW